MTHLLTEDHDTPATVDPADVCPGAPPNFEPHVFDVLPWCPRCRERGAR